MTRETMEAWENACEMHFAAFQNFMRLTDGDISLSLQLTTSYTTAFLKSAQTQEQDEKINAISDDSLGNRIVILLRKRGLTQKELAEKTKISEVTLSRYIHGDRQPRANNIANIANVLQTTTDYLLGGENQNDFK